MTLPPTRSDRPGHVELEPLNPPALPGYEYEVARWRPALVSGINSVKHRVYRYISSMPTEAAWSLLGAYMDTICYLTTVRVEASHGSVFSFGGPEVNTLEALFLAVCLVNTQYPQFSHPDVRYIIKDLQPYIRSILHYYDKYFSVYGINNPRAATMLLELLWTFRKGCTGGPDFAFPPAHLAQEMPSEEMIQHVKLRVARTLVHMRKANAQSLGHANDRRVRDAVVAQGPMLKSSTCAPHEARRLLSASTKETISPSLWRPSPARQPLVPRLPTGPGRRMPIVRRSPPSVTRAQTFKSFIDGGDSSDAHEPQVKKAASTPTAYEMRDVLSDLRFKASIDRGLDSDVAENHVRQHMRTSADAGKRRVRFHPSVPLSSGRFDSDRSSDDDLKTKHSRLHPNAKLASGDSNLKRIVLSCKGCGKNPAKKQTLLLPCSHLLCTECWIRSTTCPTCRFILPDNRPPTVDVSSMLSLITA